ncbi:uncharacterized protein LOC143057470 [Mytilus galloprovincialis]|uniref:uncharacterized protein LOC143057470 n=1 Tax=Mytilus galloprovincialis TaxID=29158 RepID=UPI003F7BE157
MKCVQPHSGNQRTETSGQTEEETIQETNHSDDSLPVTQGEDEHEEQPTEVEQLDEAEEIERIEPTQLRKETREKLKTLTRVETHRRDRKKKAKERATFTANPFQYMKRLFGARGSGKLENSREEVEEHLSKTHSDERRGEDLEECEKLLTPEEPKEQFDESDLKFQEVQDVVRKARAGSAPGPNVSVVLFAAAMNLIVKSVEKPSRGPLLSSGVRQPPVRAFMDDMTVTAKTVIEGRWTLEELERMIKWARMKFKSSKSRSLIVGKGKVQDETFELAGEKIPTVGEKPVKCLGKKTGRKWKAEEAIKEAETRLKHSVIVGVTAVGRQGFGMTTKPRWDTANEKGRRELVQQKIRQMEEESRNVKAVEMEQQACPVALKDGRYTWRHDSVLKTIAAKLDTTRRKKRKMQTNIMFVNFVRAGEKKDNQAECLGILGTASDWQMTADIHQRMSFPAEIAATSLRPDIVIWSQGTRQAVLLEITVTWEDRIEEAYERKMAKYQQLY